ncbi:MAG: carboxylating nicotinate-nucleotide diphosphorylase [Nitrospirales bacterium]
MSFQIRRAVEAALAEDLAQGDVTTSALCREPCPVRAVVTAHQDLVLAGAAVAREVFLQVDPALRIVRARRDSSRVSAGQQVLVVEGDGRNLLRAERVALNFFQHLSGIATLTAQFCQAVRGYPTRIADTRKTTPGLRALQKWAVRLGGGINHRQSLGDGILIKDNHEALLRAQGVGLEQACRLARERGPHGLRVIAEAQSLRQVEAAMRGGADVVLLDNLSPAQVRVAAERIKGRAVIEVSGKVTLKTAREFAEAGGQILSVGALTHSAPAADLSLDLVPLRRRRPSSR